MVGYRLDGFVPNEHDDPVAVFLVFLCLSQYPLARSSEVGTSAQHGFAVDPAALGGIEPGARLKPLSSRL